MRDAAQGANLLDDGGGPAAAGRLLYGIRRGARVPAGDEDAVSGNCGCGDAGGRNFSQPDDRGDSKVVSGACALDPERDVQFSLGPMDTLDHAARMQDFGSKMGIDATRKWASEGFTRPWPDEILMDEATKKRVDALWKSLSLDKS